MKLSFRDVDHDVGSCPTIHRIAPQDTFYLEPGVQTQKITQNGNISLGAVLGPANLNAQIGVLLERDKNIKHHILLTGKKRLETGGYLGETMAVWSLDEDPIQKGGIPFILRTAVLLKRIPRRSFTITTEIEVKTNWRAKLVTFLGRREQMVDLEDLEVDPEDPTHIVMEGNELLRQWLAKAKEKDLWNHLDHLNLQEEFMLAANIGNTST
ncbi:hypothetical protein MKX08_005152 [Trichoderma sp. CBMAI-0020]|nr:hypothetical protein MKX08_005152 [Trichoderma sp. CBMAI-0020]